MTFMRRFLAWFSGEGFCPACEHGLQEHEAGYFACGRCSAVVDYTNGRWQYAGGQWRRLPGVAGITFTEDAA